MGNGLGEALKETALEDDEDIHTMWANILSSAATDNKPQSYPAVINVLKQLSKHEVVFYNALHADLERRLSEYNSKPENERMLAEYPYKIPTGYEVIFLYLNANGFPNEAHNDYEAEIDVAFDNLTRLGLLRDPPHDDSLSAFGSFFGAVCRHPEWFIPFRAQEQKA